MLPLAAAAVFSATVVLSVVLTMAVRAAAPRLKLVDRPDNRRKLHDRPIALGGGLAVFLSSVLVLAALLYLPNPWRASLVAFLPKLATLFAGSLVIIAVGLLDDRFRLNGRYKLLGQLAAASVLTFGGLMIQRVSVFGYEIELGLLAIPFTLFWLLGAINSVNLLDGIDGLAALLGFLLVATIGGLGIVILAITLDRITQAMAGGKTAPGRWYDAGPVGALRRLLGKTA